MQTSSPSQFLRLFFALWPSAAERTALAAWQSALQHKCGGRAMRAEGLHATLLFLGEVEVERLEALQLAAQEVSAPAFTLLLDAAHYWGHNHIVFAAPGQVPPALLALASGLEQSLQHHHFKFDARSFKAHITLLRKARWSDSLLPAPPAVAWQMRDFALVQSVGDEQGTRYEVLARFPLNLCKS
jgi:2'-5' RNA ligase